MKKKQCQYYVFLLCCFLLALKNGLGQTGRDTLISGHFDGIKFEQFAQRVEASTPYHFYFIPDDVDSVSVALSIKGSTLSKVLHRLFDTTDIQFVIDEQNRVFITKGFAIRTTLPRHFFDHSVSRTVLADQEEKEVRSLQASKPEDAPHDNTVENRLFFIGARTDNVKSGNAVISGYIYNVRTGEPVSGAVIHSNRPQANALTDQYGYFSIVLPRGRRTLLVRALGMFDAKREVMLYSDGQLDINLVIRVIPLKTVKVEADKSRNVKTTQMGMNKINIQAIKQIPAVFGETDILRAVLALPGVLSAGEASTGFNVRGGATDQNLVLFNGNTIYNPSHFFGFFSAFDPDVVKEVELYKSNIPVQYGGRLSSVLNVNSKEGNKKEFKGAAGIGLLTAKAYVEGPIIRDSTSFIAGFRTTYSNWMMRFLPREYRKAKASFYDGTLHLSHKMNEKDNLYITGYMSNDQFNLAGDTTYGYQNINGNIKWKHLFNNQFYGAFTAGYDHYQYQLTGYKNPVNAYQLKFGIDQFNLKADFTYSINNSHTLKFGFGSILYKLKSGSYLPVGKSSLVVPDILPDEKALETAVYIADHFILSDKLAVDYGIRYSNYNYLGPKDIYTYPPGVPREINTIQDTIAYSPWKIINTNHGLDVRTSVRYLLPGDASLKVSFNSMHQYIHMLSNTAIISSTDIWKLSDPNIKPQKGYQVSLGLYKNFKSNTIETSLEVYYKQMKHYLDYKSGALLVMNHHIETDLISTRGRDYGVEFLVRKTFGKLNGWLSYTYSRALLQADDPLTNEQINGGKYYPAGYDKPNSFNFIGNYRVSHRFSLSLNVVYSTGRPITLPIAIYDYGNSGRVFYSERNQYRIPDYFRTDFSVNIEGNAKVHQLTHNSWTLGVYNMLGRKNPYSVYFLSEGGTVKGYKLSIFGSAIPFITYNIRF